MSSNVDPPDAWLSSDEDPSPYSPDDYAETPYPRASAIVPGKTGGAAGAFADWSFQESTTDDFNHSLDVSITWNPRQITFRWTVHNLMNPGEVWIGFGTVQDRESERWYLVDDARLGEQLWRIDRDHLLFGPCSDKWWFEILIEPKAPPSSP